tara:strand:- start:108 stop:506 length:399 start_codon:yes stop_codon:yes gene_type:complete
MTKEELETNLAALKLLKNEANDKLESFKQQVKDTEKQLEDYNKPELTTHQLGVVEDLISNAIGDFNFDNQDLYEIEYGLDYDAKVFADNINFRDTYELTEVIVQAVTNFFKEVPNPDDTDTSSGAFIINNPS